MSDPRSLLQLSALPSSGVRALLSSVRRVGEGPLPPLTARGPLALLCARPLPFVRSVFEGGAALLGLRVAVYTPPEVSAMGDAGLAGARLAQVHPALVGIGLPAGMLAELATAPVPVINGGDGDADPVGALADLSLFERWFGELAGRRLTWVGDASGLLYDLLSGGGGLGLSTAIAHPVGFAPDPERLTVARERAAETGAAVLVTNEIAEATADASVVYVDVWPEDHVERFRPFAIQRHTLRGARAGVRVLHRRPDHRGAELSASFADDVAAAARAQHRARVEACAAVLAACLRPDPLVAVVG